MQRSSGVKFAVNAVQLH